MEEKRRDTCLEQAKIRFEKIVMEMGLMDEDVAVHVKVLSPQEAIGNPERRDFPIVTGKERVIEASFKGAIAHAFTDSPYEFSGKVKEIIKMPLTENRKRAIFVVSMNAILKSLKKIDKTIHCRDNEPERCAEAICEYIKGHFNGIKVGLLGLNPAILDGLVKHFGQNNIYCTDLNGENIGTIKFGVEIWDGNNKTERLISHSGLILVTGTTFVNGTFDEIWGLIERYKRDYLIFGVTSAGICRLNNLNRICPYGRD